MTAESSSKPPSGGFVSRALVASVLLVAVYAVARASWQLADIVLLLFVAVVLAVGLRGLADAVRRRLPLGHGAALGLVLLLLVGTAVGCGFAIAPSMQRQVEEARTQLPVLQQRVDDWITWARTGLRQATGAEAPPRGGSPTGEVVEQLQRGPSADILSWLKGFVGSASQVIGGPLLATVVAIYLAAAPEPYRYGLLALVPVPHRPRAREILDELEHGLRSWLVGQVAAMTIVGVATTVGLWIIGVDLALLLGILAGLLDFIPNFGPAIAFLPAVLVAAGTGKVLPVAALYVAVQLLEGWLLRPLIERKAVDTLPAVLLATQVLLAVLLGFMGLLAAPALIVLVQVLVRRLYVEDVLGDRGEDRASAGRTLDHP